MASDKQSNAKDAINPSFKFEADAARLASSNDAGSSGTQTSPLRRFDKENNTANQLFGKVELIDSSMIPQPQDPLPALKKFSHGRAELPSVQIGEDNLIAEATDARGRTRSYVHNENRELVQVKMENDETWTRAEKEGDVWIWQSDKGSPDRRLLNQQVLNDGTLFVETSAQNRIYFHQDGSKEIVDHKEMLVAAQALKEAMSGPGTDELAIFQGLDGKTAAQTECIQNIYEKEFDATLSDDLWEELSGSDFTRAEELIHGYFDRVSEVNVALTELSGYTGRSDDTLEALIRNTIRTMSSADLDEADERSLEHGEWTFRNSLQLSPDVSAQTKSTTEILLKGFDKLTLEDHHKMANIALESRNSDLFKEAMRFSPKEVRDYYGIGDGKAKVQEAFGAKWYETVTALALTGAVPIVGIAFSSQLRQREQHADDYAEHGKLKLSTQVYENSSLLGDNEAAIENSLANLSDEERQQYRIGRWLNEKKGVANSLPASDEEAFSKYTKADKESAKSFYSETSKALKHVAGLWFNDSAMESEFMKWEASITTPGGGLIAQVASHSGSKLGILDSDTDDVLRDIENMSEGEWSRLQSEQGYKEKVESALGTFLSESDLSKARDILDAKQSSDSYEESKKARRGIIDMVADNVGLTVDETEIYDALQNIRDEDAAALRQHGGNNKLAQSLRVMLATNLSSDEQHAAAGLLNGIIENGDSKKTIIDTLNIHAADKNTDERLVVMDIEKAFREDPELRAKVLDFDSKFSQEFIAAAKHAVGSRDYETYIKPIVETGDLNFDVRMTLNTWLLNDDENNSFEDLASYGKSLDGLSMEQRLEMASKSEFQDKNFSYLNDEERKIAVNAFAQGELRPEDKIRAAVLGGGTDENAIRSVLNEVRRSDKFNGLAQSEFNSLIKADLARMKVDYARKYNEDLQTRLVDELSRRDMHQAELNLNVRSSEAEFLLAQRRASETRDGFGSSLNDAIWDGTGFQVDESMRALVEAMQLQPNRVSQFAQELHAATGLHANSKEAMANAIVDATLAAAAVGASFFTGGVSLSLLSTTAFAGALFKVGAKSLVMGADYDFASMGISDAAGGAFEAATIFLGTNLLKVGSGAGVKAAKDALAMGGDDLLREGSEAILKAFENDVEKLIVNSLKQRAQGITNQAIAEIALKYARPQQAEALAAILTKSIGTSVQEVGEQWLKTTALRAANNTVDGAIGGGGAGTLAAMGSAENIEQVAKRGLVSAGIGSVSAGAVSIGFSVAGRAFRKSGGGVEEGLPESVETYSPSHGPESGSAEVDGLGSEELLGTASSKKVADTPKSLNTSDALESPVSVHNHISPSIEIVKPADAVELAMKKSVVETQALFNEAGSLGEVMEAKKSLYNVQFERITEPEGRYIATLENPSVMVKQGDFIATRLNPDGTPNLERGQVNQWSMKAEKIAKTYNTTVDVLNQSTGKMVAPTRTDGPTVHMVQAQAGGEIQTKWGAMKYEAGDWLANYDYDKVAGKAGKDYAVITNVSRKATYEPATENARAVFNKLELNRAASAGDIRPPAGSVDPVIRGTEYDAALAKENLGVVPSKTEGKVTIEKLDSPEIIYKPRAIDAASDQIRPGLRNPEASTDDLVLRSEDHFFSLKPGQSKVLYNGSLKTSLVSRGDDGFYTIEDLSGGPVPSRIRRNATWVNGSAVQPNQKQRIGEFDLIDLDYHSAKSYEHKPMKIEVLSRSSSDLLGFDGQPISVEGAFPSRSYSHGEYSQILWKNEKTGLMGLNLRVEESPLTIRVNVCGSEDLRLVQSALIPELGRDSSISKYIASWSTMDPKYGLGLGKTAYGPHPSGYGDGAVGFTVFLKKEHATETLLVADEIDSILNRSGLSISRPLQSGNPDTIVGSSNRVGLFEDHGITTPSQLDKARELESFKPESQEYHIDGFHHNGDYR